MAEAVPQVLVSGASGYIATHVVQQLLKSEEYKVRGTVRSTSNEEKCAPLRNLHSEAKYPLELVEADLTNEKCWLPAVQGCTYVLHVASPFPAASPSHEDELIKPAVEGTLNVLKACAEAGCVKRVVLTSSVAAISNGFEKGGKYNEENWTDPQNPNIGMYTKSKVMAEKAAWDFHKELQSEDKFELVVINPVYVVGPVLCGVLSTSQEVVKRLLERQIPLVPKINMACVDVRDVAKAHIIAMTLPEVNGQRHILSTENYWFKDIAKVLDAEFRPQGYNVPTKAAPNIFVSIIGLFDKSVRSIKTSLNKVTEFDTRRMNNVLGITPIDVKQSFIEMAYSMIDHGKIKKMPGYKNPSAEK